MLAAPRPRLGSRPRAPGPARRLRGLDAGAARARGAGREARGWDRVPGAGRAAGGAGGAASAGAAGRAGRGQAGPRPPGSRVSVRGPGSCAREAGLRKRAPSAPGPQLERVSAPRAGGPGPGHVTQRRVPHTDIIPRVRVPRASGCPPSARFHLFGVSGQRAGRSRASKCAVCPAGPGFVPPASRGDRGPSEDPRCNPLPVSHSRAERAPPHATLAEEN